MKHFRHELDSSFFVERALAKLLARRHKATDLRRQMEADGQDWHDDWDQELDDIERRIGILSNRSPMVASELEDPTSVETSHLEILDCLRRLALAKALKQEFQQRSLAWPPAWAKANHELNKQLEQLVLRAIEDRDAGADERVDAGKSRPPSSVSWHSPERQ